MSLPPVHHVVVLGLPGTGAASVAQQLAKQFNLRFIDMFEQLQHDPAMRPFEYQGRYAESDINRYALSQLSQPATGYAWCGYPASPAQWRFFTAALHERHQPLLLIADIRVNSPELAIHLVRTALGQAHPAGIGHIIGDDLRMRHLDRAEHHQATVALMQATTTDVYLTFDFMMGETVLRDSLTKAYLARVAALDAA